MKASKVIAALYQSVTQKSTEQIKNNQISMPIIRNLFIITKQYKTIVSFLNFEHSYWMSQCWMHSAHAMFRSIVILYIWQR